MLRPLNSAAAESLRKRLVWITVFRTVAAVLLTGALVVRTLSRSALDELSTLDRMAFGVESSVFGLTLLYGLWLRAGRFLRTLAWLQVLGDVSVAAALVLVTGGVDSPFSFLFLLAVLGGAILLSNTGAIIATAVSTLAFCLVVLALESDSHLPFRRLMFAMAVNLVSQVLVAILATYLARQLSAAGGRLSAREDDLRKMAVLQRQILASMPSGLVTCTPQGQVTFINRAGLLLLGLADRPLKALSIEELLPGFRAIKPGNLRAELKVETPSGPRTLGLGIAELAETPDSLLVVFQDLTELRRAETSLKRADELAALGKLSAQLAHEIRNPLASMRGSAQMLEDDLPSDAVSRRLVQILIRESDRLESLVEDFLKFASPSRPSRKWVRLDQLVAETAELISADPISSGVQLTRDLVPAEAAVDPHQLKQVLLNLMRNALQAVGPGGAVKVSVDNGPEQIAVRVWDSAGKIAPEELTKIFEPFYTTRRGGTGLGLSTAQTIVSAHGGRIEVSSSPRQGTEFAIQLPKEPVAEVKRA